MSGPSGVGDERGSPPGSGEPPADPPSDAQRLKSCACGCMAILLLAWLSANLMAVLVRQ